MTTKTISIELLDSVTGGAGNRVTVSGNQAAAGDFAYMCGAIDKKADASQSARWRGARRSVADGCWDTLRGTVAKTTK